MDYAMKDTLEGSWLFLAMEPCVERLPSGQFVSCTLEWLVRGSAASAHHRAMGWRDARLGLARDMSAGLAFLHSAGVLHRALSNFCLRSTQMTLGLSRLYTHSPL